jgi:hypothetical protein
MLELSLYLEDKAVNTGQSAKTLVVGNPNDSLGHLIPGAGFCFLPRENTLKRYVNCSLCLPMLSDGIYLGSFETAC